MLRTRRDGHARKVLVAGGGGFLGSHLCQALLEDGSHVFCIDNFLTSTPENIQPLRNNPTFHLVEHDICERLRLEENGFDEVYNLACAASPPRYQADPVHTMMTSVAGTKNLLEFAERNDATYLQASTSEVYGDPEEHPQRETYRGSVNCTGPRACYDEGKRAAEALCFDFLRLGRVDARVARIFNTYGPRMQPCDGRIISNLVSQAIEGRALTVYGTGNQTRSFCYVSDLIAGVVALMRVPRNPDGPVNLGNPGEFTINELADMVVRHIPTRSRIVYQPLPQDDPRRRCPDISRARALLGWEPKVPLEKGIGETIDWFRASAGNGVFVEPPQAPSEAAQA